MPVRISTLIKSWDEYSRIPPLPELKEIPHEKVVKGFSVKLDRNAKMKQLVIPVGFLKEYNIDKTVAISNATIYIHKGRTSAAFIGEGTFNLCDKKFQVKIEQTKSGETFLTGQSTKPIVLSTIELAFGFRQPTERLSKIMKVLKILKLQISNPKLKIQWNNKEQRTMEFSGKAYSEEWGKVKLEFLLGGNQSFWAAAIITTRQRFKKMFDLATMHEKLDNLLQIALDFDKVCT